MLMIGLGPQEEQLLENMLKLVTEVVTCTVV